MKRSQIYARLVLQKDLQHIMLKPDQVEAGQASHRLLSRIASERRRLPLAALRLKFVKVGTVHHNISYS